MTWGTKNMPPKKNWSRGCLSNWCDADADADADADISKTICRPPPYGGVDIIKNACGNTKKIWHSINEISGKHKSKIPRKMHIADKEVTDRAEIVKEFSKYFANVASNLISSETWNSDDQYEVTPDFQAFVQSRLPSDTKFSIPLITPSRVKDLLLHLDPSKATGMDGISPYILQRS